MPLHMRTRSVNVASRLSRDHGRITLTQFRSKRSIRNYCTKSKVNSDAKKPEKYSVVVGLEIHTQISSNTKLFSNATCSSTSIPNSKVSVVDAAHPGTLPVLNMECVKQAVKLGQVFGGTVHTRSTFDRKHYFYPDLPHGFQITQFYNPIVTGGSVKLHLNNNTEKEIRISRIQLEMVRDVFIYPICNLYN
jgi:hypothetical protein